MHWFNPMPTVADGRTEPSPTAALGGGWNQELEQDALVQRVSHVARILTAQPCDALQDEVQAALA